MKKIVTASMVAFLLIYSCTDTNAGNNKVELKTFMDSVSYSMGFNMGKNLQRDDIKINLDIMSSAMASGMEANAVGLIEEAGMQDVMMQFQNQMRAAAAEQQAKQGEENIAKGKKFLEDNKSKEGVKVTASGLQYKVIKQGTGKMPSATNTVKVHYHGTVVDGTVFDSSVERKEPSEFPLNGVIKGWTEGIQLMKEGAKFIFYIPAELAYGAQRRSAVIGPNEVLIFEVELLEIK